MTKLELSDNFEALVLALELAITAPSTSKIKKMCRHSRPTCWTYASLRG
jgi:hypothetical protein